MNKLKISKIILKVFQILIPVILIVTIIMLAISVPKVYLLTPVQDSHFNMSVSDDNSTAYLSFNITVQNDGLYPFYGINFGIDIYDINNSLNIGTNTINIPEIRQLSYFNQSVNWSIDLTQFVNITDNSSTWRIKMNLNFGYYLFFLNLKLTAFLPFNVT